ncbi:hypothetical protein [Synechocystis sp. LKSZ1]|uniref:hypothetical protein n=1 Tax=Synechocystis sp. LKSZ1 TaxID=3144951 RepID=UPI00336BC908
MSNATLFSEPPLPTDSMVWDSLKQAIAASSGFKCWQEDQVEDSDATVQALDHQVRHYLRQTLETLAY